MYICIYYIYIYTRASAHTLTHCVSNVSACTTSLMQYTIEKIIKLTSTIITQM